jgi:hypothetical protein
MYSSDSKTGRGGKQKLPLVFTEIGQGTYRLLKIVFESLDAIELTVDTKLLSLKKKTGLKDS